MAENENNSDIPAGEAPETPDLDATPQFVEIPDRSTANAKRALQAARNLDIDDAEVRTNSTSFIVPVAVGDEYDRLLSEEVAATTAVTEGDGELPPVGPDEPRKSASKADWEAFAVAQGYDVAEGLSRDELVARFGTPAE